MKSVPSGSFVLKEFFSVLAGGWAAAGIATQTFGGGAGRISTLRVVWRSLIALQGSAQPLDLLAWTKNPPFLRRKTRTGNRQCLFRCFRMNTKLINEEQMSWRLSCSGGSSMIMDAMSPGLLHVFSNCESLKVPYGLRKPS